MDLSTALSADLDNLMRIVGLGDSGLDDAVQDLHTDLAAAVPSYVGFALTLVTDQRPVALTSLTHEALPTPIASSLALPLSAEPPRGSVVVLYATAPRAFVALAAGLAQPLSAAQKRLILDQDQQPTFGSGLAGVEEHSILNRAIGVLMGRGHTPEGARAQLQRKATDCGLGVLQVAAYIVGASE